MLRTSVERDLLDAHRDGEYVFPAYGDYCFANVNPTLLSLLGPGGSSDDGGWNPAPARRLPGDVFTGIDRSDVERVVTVFLDGYGWEHWKRDHEEVPLLSAFGERGVVTPLTAIYPSETAAATTTFHTGRTPVEHGLLGWWQYVDDVDGVVQSLPFVTLDGDPADGTYPDLEKSTLFEGDSLYERATDAGIDARLHQPFPTDDPQTAGAETTTHENAADLGVSLRRAVETADSPDYHYAYVPNVDAASHRVGTASTRYRAQLEMVCACLRREFVERADPADPERTLVVLTADHGIVDTRPDENVDLRGVDVVWENLRRDGDGEPVPPVGSPRNLHLFLREGTVERVRDAVESRWLCRTYSRAEAVEASLFGDAEPGDLFRRRCGDLVVVHRDSGMWWDDAELEQVGMHGGLTREEMLVPFAAATLADLAG